MKWLIIAFLLLSIYGCEREKEKHPTINTVKPEVELEQMEKEKEKEVYLQKAESCIYEGDYEQAVLFLQKAIGLSPNDASLYYRLGNVYSRLQEDELAVNAYIIAIELDPEKNFLEKEKP